jgi:ApbE superfamily uncharacterized protein (UPF0280 family)
MRRDTLTTDPREGDYILSPTGLTWNVLRSSGGHSGQSISVGDPDRKTALARLRSLAETDSADGWETAGTGLFWQITRFRK